MRYRPSLETPTCAWTGDLREESAWVDPPYVVLRTVVQGNGTRGYTTGQQKSWIRSGNLPGGIMMQESSAAQSSMQPVL